MLKKYIKRVEIGKKITESCLSAMCKISCKHGSSSHLINYYYVYSEGKM